MDGLIRVAAIGCGNVGQKAVEAIGAAPDMVLAGIVETAKNIPRIRENLSQSGGYGSCQQAAGCGCGDPFR